MERQGDGGVENEKMSHAHSFIGSIEIGVV